jgi:hypothetical protein
MFFPWIRSRFFDRLIENKQPTGTEISYLKQIIPHGDPEKCHGLLLKIGKLFQQISVRD